MDNSPCLCCSGKLYKDCCKPKKKIRTETEYKMFMREFDDKHKNYKKCMHPQRSECTNIIHAHTISQKAVLEEIADNKQVLMPIEFGISKQFVLKSLGIESKASKFYCFCKKHDELFYPIDKKNVDFSTDNCFLYAYRAFASTYYKIERELYCYKELKEKYDLTYNPVAILTFLGMERNVIQLDRIRKIFDDAIINNAYDVLENTLIELDYKVFFAATTCFCPMVDLYGGELPWDDESIPLVYISIIPDESHTKIIISWLKEDTMKYKNFKEQLNNVPINFVLKYINNLLPLNCENIVLSPKLWNKWSNEAQEQYKMLSSEHFIDTTLKYDSENYYADRLYDLFDKVTMCGI